MKRFLNTVLFATLCASSVLACDKPGATEQQREMTASEKADQSRGEADKNVANAQATADKNVAAAQADFDKAREDYRHSRAQDLNDIDKKIGDLETTSRTATGKRKVELAAKLPSIHAQRDAFVRDMQNVNSMNGTAWDEAKGRLDKEWDALQAAVANA